MPYPSNHPASVLSAHADYRREDYYFPRTQSRAMAARDWEKSPRPLHTWSEVLYPALGLAAVALAALEIVH